MNNRYTFKAKRKDNGEIDLSFLNNTKLSFVKMVSKGKALLKCECGNETVQLLSYIESGRIKSCGCQRYKDLSNRNTKHGLKNTRIYRIWIGIKKRCNNPNATDYKNYGARGIKICKEWNDNFINFYDWAISNRYDDDLTIERINVNGNYEPNNCCWITKKDQAKNRRKRTDFSNRDSKGKFTKIIGNKFDKEVE